MEQKTKQSELILKLVSARLTIKKLKRELESIKVNWALYLFDLVSDEIYNYEKVLSPYPAEIKASHSNKPLLYEINVLDIIAIVADQRNKTVYVTRETKNIEGKLNRTKKITVNRNKLKLVDLCNEIESPQFYLVQISKNVCINMRYYSTDWKNAYLDSNLKGFDELVKLSVGKPYLDNYRKRYQYYNETISLHSLMSQYKEKKRRFL